MIKRKTKFAVAFASVVALSAVTVSLALAAGGNLSPPNTLIHVALKKGTTSAFAGTVDGTAVTVTCARSSTSFTTPATGLGPITTANPKFTGCTDSLGGTDTIKTNSTNGAWETTFVAANGAKPAQLKLTVPKAGATIVSSILPSCTVTVAPKAPATAKASYDNVNTATFTNAKLPTAPNANCTTGASGTLNATYVLTPGVKITP